MFKFRDYQSEIIKKGLSIIKEYRYLYLAMEVRTGKTLTSMGILNEYGVKSLVFLTKKKAISSIEHDYKLLNPSYSLQVINYQSLHKVEWKGVDAVVLDEAHTMGSFPKPGLIAKNVRKELSKLDDPIVIWMSGTPTPESFCQMYHQMWAHPYGPWSKYKNFYRWADSYADVGPRLTKWGAEMKINGFTVKDYSKGKRRILDESAPFTISYTQAQAGFVTDIEEEIVYIDMEPSTKKIINRLRRDKVVEGREEVILGDTGVKMMSKVHQMCSGTIKFESGKTKVLDTKKADWIRWKFKGQKIGVFYKFTAELDAMKQVFGDDLTTDLDEFNNSNKSIALQIVSGREGISLRKAEHLVFYNIDFSATSYWQARDRMTTKDRSYNKVFWIFSKGGIERDIYAAVCEKKNYTLNHFKGWNC
jgi:hypothetical protein